MLMESQIVCFFPAPTEGARENHDISSPGPDMKTLIEG
jgi:hypothetical protein